MSIINELQKTCKFSLHLLYVFNYTWMIMITFILSVLIAVPNYPLSLFFFILSNNHFPGFSKAIPLKARVSIIVCKELLISVLFNQTQRLINYFPRLGISLTLCVEGLNLLIFF